MKFTLATVSVLVLTLSACAANATTATDATAPNTIGPKLVAQPDALPLKALPLGEVRGGTNMTKHSPESLLRALILPLDKAPSCTADTDVNPRWAQCGHYELSDCRGGAYGFICDVVVDDLAIGNLTSRVSGQTWSFTAHWDAQSVNGVRDFDGAVVQVSQ